MPKFRVKKFYQQYDGEFEIKAPDETRVPMLARDWLFNEGFDPDEYQFDIEEIPDAPSSDVRP